MVRRTKRLYQPLDPFNRANSLLDEPHSNSIPIGCQLTGYKIQLCGGGIFVGSARAGLRIIIHLPLDARVTLAGPNCRFALILRELNDG